MLRESEKIKIRKGPINMLTYRVDEKKHQIQLLNIRSTRQKPVA